MASSLPVAQQTPLTVCSSEGLQAAITIQCQQSTFLMLIKPSISIYSTIDDILRAAILDRGNTGLTVQQTAGPIPFAAALALPLPFRMAAATSFGLRFTAFIVCVSLSMIPTPGLDFREEPNVAMATCAGQR